MTKYCQIILQYCVSSIKKRREKENSAILDSFLIFFFFLQILQIIGWLPLGFLTLA